VAQSPHSSADGSAGTPVQAAPPAKPPIWNDPVWRAVFFQVLVLGGVILFAVFLVQNTMANLERQGIASGFAFLERTAGFSIGETHLLGLFAEPYAEEDHYAKTFWVGFLNTIFISFWGIVLATIIGFIMGVMRLSRNWLISRLATVYIETLRNIPLLLQIFFWYFAVLRPLPGPRESLTFLDSFFLNNRGLSYPRIIGQEELALFIPVVWVVGLAMSVWFAVKWTRESRLLPKPPASQGRTLWATIAVFAVAFILMWFGPSLARFGSIIALAGLVATIVAPVVLLTKWAHLHQDRTGDQFPIFLSGLGVVVGVPLVIFLAIGAPISFESPELKGFNYRGGNVLSPEFTALLLALSTYTAAFIAEIVRAGILAVSHGQTEAAYAVGLRPGPTMRLVIIPQALRVIIPPLTSQYLNLTKNSSLAAAIAYPDLVLVFAGTTLMQTGQAVEIIAITMTVYLTLSLLISSLMNWYNNKMALVER
jgi:general L-amino acid transport system permease protein